MKRLTYLMMAALMVAFASCEKEPETNPKDGDNGNGQTTTDPTTPTGGYDSITLVLKASNIKTAWAAGDEVQVYCVTAAGADVEAKYVLTEGAGSATGKFAPASGETAVEKGGRDYFAAYPYDPDRTFAQHNTFTAVIPSEQTAAMPVFAHATDAANMELASFMGAIKFTISGEAELKSIALEDKNTNSILSGNVTYNAKTGKANIKNSSASKHEISYPFPEKLVLNGTSDPYVIEVPAGALAEGGKITLFDMNDNAAAVIDVPAQTIAAGVVSNVGNLAFEAVSQTVDLSIAGTANSYIIPATGAYKFKAVKGNSSEAVSAAKVEVFWETRMDNAEIEAGSVIASAKLEGNYVVVETAKPFVPGNALIAAKDAEDNILWSWHLWLPETTVATIPDPDAVLFSTELMDRNLGAMAPTDTTATALEKSYGLYYAWGRKDPLVGTMFTAAGAQLEGIEGAFPIEYWIAHPNQATEGADNDWNSVQSLTDNWSTAAGEKAVYDPCPPGYRVPVYNTEYQLWIKRQDANWGFNLEQLWIYHKATKHTFPLCGWVSADHMSRVGERALIWSATPGLGSEEQPRGSAALFNLTAAEGQWYNYHSYFRYAAGNIRCAKEH